MKTKRTDAKARLPKGLYLRGRGYWLRWTPVEGGEQVRQSLGTEDLAEAIAEAARVRRETGAQLREVAGSCEAELERYLAAKAREGLSASTLSSRRYVLAGFASWCGAESPRGITPGMCARWFEERLERHEHTAVAYLHQVRWWFAWLMESGRMGHDPSSGIKMPKLKMRARKRFITAAEARAVVEACEDVELRFAVMCGLHAGMRKLEIIEARPEWFDLEAGLIHIQKTATFEPKDRDNRTVPMSEDLRAFLQGYGLRGPFMLASAVKHGKARYRFDFRKAYDSLMRRCGLDDVTFHDLRRTFASLLVSRGVSLYKVAKWLGDELETVQLHYGHLIPQDAEINAAWRTAKAE
jgi:integrase